MAVAVAVAVAVARRAVVLAVVVHYILSFEYKSFSSIETSHT